MALINNVVILYTVLLFQNFKLRKKPTMVFNAIKAHFLKQTRGKFDQKISFHQNMTLTLAARKTNSLVLNHGSLPFSSHLF